MKSFKHYLTEEIKKKDLETLQKVGQKQFNGSKCKLYDITFRVATHSYDNFNDPRNESPITMAHLIRILKKGIPQLCSRMEEFMNEKGCFIDQKTFTNLPFTVTDDADGVINVNTNSAQNKKDYWLPTGQIPIYIK